MSEELRTPNLTDYMAGAMLANGFVWMWSILLGNLSNRISKIPVNILADIAYIVYVSGGIVSSYLVCKRTSTRHLFVGLKLAALSWVFSLFLSLSSATGPTIGLTIVLLACLTGGSVAGAYLALKAELRPK